MTTKKKQTTTTGTKPAPDIMAKLRQIAVTDEGTRLLVQDLESTLEILAYAFRKGIFEPADAATFGNVFNKLARFHSEFTKEKEAVDDSTKAKDEADD